MRQTAVYHAVRVGGGGKEEGPKAQKKKKKDGCKFPRGKPRPLLWVTKKNEGV